MNEYKTIQCINQMERQYYEAFEHIVQEYAPKLSARIITDESAYTLHDFEHHCFNVYKIISYVLFDAQLIYNSDYGLSQKELFILNLSVLFHDIGMSNVLGASRENHSLKSAEYIQAEFDNTRSVLRTKADLTLSELKALKAIVTAHSDIKDGTIENGKNGLNSPDLKDYQAKNGKIRSKFLAGVLRLADELDISSERLGTCEIEQQIEEGRKKYEYLKVNHNTEIEQKELKKWEGYLNSLIHWKKLYLISSVQRHNDGETIEIYIDDDYIEHCLDEGKTEKSISRQLVDVYIEVEKKLKETIQIAFAGTPFSKYVSVKKIQFITKNNALEKEISNNLSVRSLNFEEKKVEQTKRNEIVQKTCFPKVLDEILEQEIYEEIHKRNLMRFGHFLLNDKYCARDWIDTREVVETKKILNKLVQTIVKDIHSKQHNDYAIVGVDLVGALLASRIAFSLQKPLSYIVSKKEETSNANQEIELILEKNRDIILITDAIVTYDTIEKAIEKHLLKERIDSIYTIFYRPSKEFINKSNFDGKIFSINNLFTIELFKKENCVYNVNGCIAQNRRLNEGDKE